MLSFPALSKVPEGFEKKGEEGRFTVYERVVDAKECSVSVRKLSEEEETAAYEISVTYPEHFDRETARRQSDILLNLSYAGYGLEVYRDPKMINDHFYTGQEVPLSLGYFDFPEKLTVKVKALHENDWVFIEKWPELHEGRALSLESAGLKELFF
jgi:hypothetical protein